MPRKAMAWPNLTFEKWKFRKNGNIIFCFIGGSIFYSEINGTHLCAA